MRAITRDMSRTNELSVEDKENMVKKYNMHVCFV